MLQLLQLLHQVHDISGRLLCFADGRGLEKAVTTPPGGLGRVVSLSIGHYARGDGHTCAITAKNRSLVCFGKNGFKQLNVPADLGPVASVSAGGRHTCALTQSGAVRCFGWNGHGQIDVPKFSSQVIAVSAGSYHSCALLADGSSACWGLAGGYMRPAAAAGRQFTSVVAGEFSTCATTTNLTVVCAAGMSDGYSPPEAPSFEELGPIVQIGASSITQNCAVRVGGVAACWGFPANHAGLDGFKDVRAVGVGNGHACALMQSGAMRCFSPNGFGYGYYLPDELKKPGAVLEFAVGSYHTCAIARE